jgi:hypothetical protein
MDCAICLTNYQPDDFKTLHDEHKVCSQCYISLRSHFHMTCPICRHPINQDLRQYVPSNNFHQRIISDAQLLFYDISQEFIDQLHNENIIPFYYTGRFEGVDFIRQVKEDYDNWLHQEN